jgi:hypothetical protein
MSMDDSDGGHDLMDFFEGTGDDGDSFFADADAAAVEAARHRR